MKPSRQLNRRSFLGRVSGGALFGAGTLLLGARAARAQTGPYTGITDTDSGAHADNAGHGRGPGGNAWGQPAQPQQNYTGCSDSDSGNGADPSGGGRRCRQQQSGLTDSDPSDPYGQGRGTSVRANRRRNDGRCVHHTGRTDSDSGLQRDPSGYGHGGNYGSNLLPDAHCSG